MKQSKILSGDPQPLVIKGRILKGICYNQRFGGLLKICVFFVFREDGVTSEYKEGRRVEGGWLKHPCGSVWLQLQGGTSG